MAINVITGLAVVFGVLWNNHEASIALANPASLLSPEDYDFRIDAQGKLIGAPKRASIITPIKANAMFFSEISEFFHNGFVNGTINFAQANYPSNPATMVNINLTFPKVVHDRIYRIDILYSGYLTPEYCTNAKRYKEFHYFKMAAGNAYYSKTFKTRNINIIDENRSIIGRTARISAIRQNLSLKNTHCTIIGRLDDEVSIDKDDTLKQLALQFNPGSVNRRIVPILIPKSAFIPIQ